MEKQKNDNPNFELDPMYFEKAKKRLDNLSLQDIEKMAAKAKATPSSIANDLEFKIIDYVSLITNNPINKNNNEK